MILNENIGFVMYIVGHQQPAMMTYNCVENLVKISVLQNLKIVNFLSNIKTGILFCICQLKIFSVDFNYLQNMAL